MEKTMLVAAYGTLRPNYGNSRLFQAAEAVHVGTGLTQEKHSMYASGIPFVVENGGTSQIEVDVFEIESSKIGPIDRLEGHPGWYERRLTKVVMGDGSIVDAWLYFNDEAANGRYTLVESGNYNVYTGKAVQETV